MQYLKRLKPMVSPVQNSAANTIYVDSDTNEIKVGSGASGTTERVLVDSASFGSLSDDILFTTDNTYDVGATGTTRPRSIYSGTTINAERAALATTSTDGFTAKNLTAATGGVTVQISPRSLWQGTAWDTAASQTVAFFAETLPATAATPIGTWKLGYSLNGAAATYPMTVSSSGTITALGSINVLGNVQAGASNVFTWSSLSKLASSADGKSEFTNNAVSAGVGLDFATDGVLKILSRAQTAVASGIQVGAGSTTVAPLTIVNGTNLTAATANAIENDGTAFYDTIDTTNGRRYSDSWNYFRLTGSGSGITSIADFFGTNDGIPLVANGVYEIEWVCYFSQATAGTATWTIVTATTNLANLTGEYVGSAVAGIGAVGTAQTAAINTTNSSSTAFPVTGTEADAATHRFKIRALLTAGAGSSNTRLRLTMSAGTATPLINSYYRVRRLAAANVGAFVA